MRPSQRAIKRFQEGYRRAGKHGGEEESVREVRMRRRSERAAREMEGAEDEAATRRKIERALRREGYDEAEARNIMRAAEGLRRRADEAEGAVGSKDPDDFLQDDDADEDDSDADEED